MTVSMHQLAASSTWWFGPQPRLVWVEMAVGLPKGPCYPDTPLTQTIFFAVLPLKRRAARILFEIVRMFSLFSCLPLACLLIFLLLLMSGNVHPNPGPIFRCVCGKSDVEEKIGAMLHLL